MKCFPTNPRRRLSLLPLQGLPRSMLPAVVQAGLKEVGLWDVADQQAGTFRCALQRFSQPQ